MLPELSAAMEQAVVASAGDTADSHGPSNPFGHLGMEDRNAIFVQAGGRDPAL